jgi:hypothetical protein
MKLRIIKKQKARAIRKERLAKKREHEAHPMFSLTIDGKLKNLGPMFDCKVVIDGSEICCDVVGLSIES